MECLEMDLGGSVVKKLFFGSNSFRVVYNQNLKSKVKVENFHIFLTASVEGGGSTHAVSLTGINLLTNRDVVWKNQATCPRPKAEDR